MQVWLQLLLDFVASKKTRKSTNNVCPKQNTDFDSNCKVLIESFPKYHFNSTQY